MSKRVSRKKHAPRIKFQVAIETLRDKNTLLEVSRQYDISPTLIHKWRKELLNKGHLIFEQGNPSQELTKKVEELQRIIGKKEVELELLKKFLGNLNPE